MKKRSLHIPKGMTKDMSPSKFSAEYYYDALNLKPVVSDSNTLLSLTNIKSNKQLVFFFYKDGYPTTGTLKEYIVSLYPDLADSILSYIGHVVLNDYVVLFVKCSANTDMILRIDFSDTTRTITIGPQTKTYDGLAVSCLAYGDFGFSKSSPIEGIGIYEKEGVQKVYWIDGIHQPRFIFIDDSHIADVITESSVLDFVTTFSKQAQVSISREVSGVGAFPSGTIQYVFTYYNINGQETNIFHYSPLYYISYNNRGGSPENTSIGVSFNINIQSPDTRFSYIRVYSLLRTATDGAVLCKRVVDLSLEDNPESLSYIDNGSSGDTVDPASLLYVGGRTFTPYTMEQKDGTLFFGNYTETGSIISDEIKEGFRNKKIEFHADKHLVINPPSPIDSPYSHKHQLDKSSAEITTFKFGETYRLGVQLMRATGEWSDPVFIGDVLNSCPPTPCTEHGHANTSEAVNLASASLDLFLSKSDEEEEEGGGSGGGGDDDPYPNYDIVLAVTWLDKPTPGKKDARPVNTITVFWKCLKGNLMEGDQLLLVFRHTNGTDNPVVNSYFIIEGSSDYQTRGSVDFTIYGTASDVSIKFKNGTNDGTETTYKDKHLFLTDDYDSDVIIRKASAKNSDSQEVPDDSLLQKLVDEGYVAIRPVMVVPSITDRTVICQGVLNPTVFNVQDRATNSPFSQASWFFRPNGRKFFSKPDTAIKYANIQFIHYDHLPSSDRRNAEIQCNYLEPDDAVTCSVNHITGSTYDTLEKKKRKFVDKYSDLFFVDQSIVTLNSPDIEFGTELSNIDDSSLALRIVGYIPITATSSDVDIETSTSVLRYWKSSVTPRGFWHEKHVSLFNADSGYGEILSAPMWFDEQYFTYKNYRYNGSSAGTDDNRGQYTWPFMVYPWHRTGSLNNQPSASDLTTKEEYLNHIGLNKNERSAMLKHKVLSTLRYSANTVYPGYLNPYVDGSTPWSTYYDTDNSTNISLGIFNSDNITNIRLDGQFYSTESMNYFGNVDRVVMSNRKPVLTHASGTNTDPSEEEDTDKATDVAGYPIITTSSISGGIDENYHDAFSSKITGQFLNFGRNDHDLYLIGTDPVHIKYKSTPHAIINIRKKPADDELLILPRLSIYTKDNDENNDYHEPTDILNPFWLNYSRNSESADEDYTLKVSQVRNYEVDNTGNGSYLWLGELYDPNPNKNLTRYGGTSDDAIANNIWIPAGDIVSISDALSASGTSKKLTLRWTEGDTYYQRYDCLKTYPYSNADTNSIVDICSFMVETRINLDGRYDKNRGPIDNFTTDPTVFNLINPGYTQRNNFFSYRGVNTDLFVGDEYKNYITWSKTKTPGELVDSWTNVTLANVLDLDGDKGAVTLLRRMNNNLLCFQEKGISQILYNENMQFSTTEGVPVEIANSGKVQGKRYLSETVGCQNKWSSVLTNSGIYFMDGNSKTIYKLGDGLEPVSISEGMTSWAANSVNQSVWDLWRDVLGPYRGYYDINKGDIFFVGNNGTDDCLVYSERVGLFTSFYSWGEACDMFNVKDKFIAVRDFLEISLSQSEWTYYSDIELYEQYGGSTYNNFFTKNHPYSITYIDSDNSVFDKTYTNIEFRAVTGNDKMLPFDLIEAWNEYQKGKAVMKNGYKAGHKSLVHHDPSDVSAGHVENSYLQRKFRIWHNDIPRNNVGIDDNPRIFDRMRNPWLYLRLTKNAESSMKSMELHDLLIDYFV